MSERYIEHSDLVEPEDKEANPDESAEEVPADDGLTRRIVLAPTLDRSGHNLIEVPEEIADKPSITEPAKEE